MPLRKSSKESAIKAAEIPLDVKLEDAGCPICLEILVEPITMPCAHRLCKPCFTKNIELTNLHCPFCKKRIGTWCRQAKDVDRLIDQRLWKYLKDNFGAVVDARLSGRTSDEVSPHDIFKVEFSHRICESGQIGEEFKVQLDEVERETKEREDKDLIKSKALIMKIQEQELGASGHDHALHTQNDLTSTPETVANGLPSRVNVSDVTDTPCLLGDRAEVEMSFDRDFVDMQRSAEERIIQAKKDEELARQLQEKEGKLRSSPASSSTPVLTRNRKPKRPMGPRQLTLEESINVKKRRLL